MSENDVFSALNIGSGLNTTELIQNLLTAERAPKEKKINDKIEKNEVSISAIAELKKSLSDSSKTIDSLENTDVFQGSSTSTSINLTHFFNSPRPIPIKYPSPPLLPGPHRIMNSDVEKSLFNISTDCLAASIIARRSSPSFINKSSSKALTCSAV